MKRQMMSKLKLLSQDLLVAVKNKAVAQKLESRLENFAQRWESLVQKVESNSKQVCKKQFFQFVTIRSFDSQMFEVAFVCCLSSYFNFFPCMIH